MANIAAVWRPATVRTIPIIHFTSRTSKRSNRTVHCDDLGAEIGSSHMVAVVGGLLDAGGNGVRVCADGRPALVNSRESVRVFNH